jgi:hypothetical protein
VAQAVERLLCKCKALSSKPESHQKKKKQKKNEVINAPELVFTHVKNS